MKRSILLAAAATVALVLPLADPAAADGSSHYLVTFATPDGWFRVEIDDPASVARLDTALAARDLSLVGIPTGRVVRGSGGINRGHRWHLEDVELVDLTMEVCDGTAAYVDANLDDWIDQVGRYCSWGARLVSFRSR